MPNLRRQRLDIPSPTKGLDYRLPDTLKDIRMASNILNCRLANGVISKDFGDSTYGGNNPLLGVPCRIDIYEQYNQTKRPLVFTTTYAYEFDTANFRWNTISKGTLISDCESAWTAKANVTAAVDATLERRGTNCNKLTLADGFTTGIAASIDFSAADVRNDTYLHYYIQSTVAVAAGDFRIRLSEQNTGATGATYADYNVPALTANTWTEVQVALTPPDASNGGTYPTDLNAVLSVALVAVNDVGACIIYIDDVRTHFRYTGTQNGSWSSAMHNNEFFAVNGADAIQRKQQAGMFDVVAGWSDYKAYDVQSFKNHLVFMNMVESGNQTPMRVRWTISGALAYGATDFTATTSGYNDLIDTPGGIIKSKFLGANNLIIYKSDSIWAMSWIGGDTVYQFDMRVPNIGLLGPRAVVSYGGIQFFVGSDKNVYIYTGGTTVEAIGDQVAQQIAATIDGTYDVRTILILDSDYNEIVVGYPSVGEEQPDTFYRYNYKEKTWTKSSRPYICVGTYQEYTTETFGTAVGTFGASLKRFGDATATASAKSLLTGDSSGYIYKIDRGTININGVAQDSYFDTIDFTVHGKADSLDAGLTSSYVNSYKRWLMAIVEAQGNDLYCYSSDDGGVSWVPIPDFAKTLSSLWETYDCELDTASRKIRFRFRNNIISSDMKIRYVGVDYLVSME